jgi:RNA polymerase sigma factor (sigma-70 family)
MKAKKEEMFKKVYEMYYSAVTRHLLYLLGSNQAAEDLAQEVFLRLYFVGVENVEYPKSWLLKTASNLAFNYLNSEKARRLREQRQAQRLERNVVLLENKFLLKEEVRYISNVLDSLGARDKTAVLLKAEGFSYREIAEVLGIPETSVGTVLARAKKRLCAKLERR